MNEQTPSPTPEGQLPTPSPAVPAAPPTDGKRHRRPRGKIARLAPPIRDNLNKLMDEGLTYNEIITRLGLDGAHLTENDMSRWYSSGHQDWIKNQVWLDDTRSRLDMAIEVIAENDGANVHLANLHVAATQLIHNLIRSGEILLAQNPEQYVALVNSVTRLGHEALHYQKYREACNQARAEIAKLKDPKRKLSEEETLAIVDKLDHILGFK